MSELPQFDTLICAPAYFHDSSVERLRKHGTVKVAGNEQEVRDVLSTFKPHVLFIRVDTKVNKELLNILPDSVKVIATATQGTDHIDLDELKQRGIALLSLRGTNTVSTAEHAWSLTLALHRHLVAANTSMMAGEWCRERFIGTSLEGKRVGLLGFGAIARRVAQYALAFECVVHAYDPFLDDKAFQEAGVRRVTKVEDLVRDADILSLHVPLTPDTQDILTVDVLRSAPKNCVLISVARGGVLAADAVAEALECGALRAAALDVYRAEGFDESAHTSAASVAHRKLLDFARTEPDRVLLTPHVGGATSEAIEAAANVSVDNVVKWFEARVAVSLETERRACALFSCSAHSSAVAVRQSFTNEDRF